MANAIRKTFTQIIYLKLQAFFEDNNILQESQMGFKKERGILDNNFCLAAVSHINLRVRKNSFYVIFIDFRRAFDTVNHNFRWEKIMQIEHLRENNKYFAFII